MLTILTRELVIALRRGTPSALLTTNGLLLAALAAAVATFAGTVSPWVAPSIGATSVAAPSGLGPTLVAWRGPALFLLLAAWIALLVTVVAPAAGARALTAERASATLELLLASGTSPLALVVGKWLGAFVQVLLLVLSGVPAFALAWLFGGVGLPVALLTASLLTAYAAVLVALGLLAGALVRGQLLPAATGAFVAGFLLLVTAGLFVAGVANGSSVLVTVGVANPLLGLAGANPDLAEALAKAVGAPPTFPLRYTVALGGRYFAAPLPLVATLVYAAWALALLPVVAVLLDPYHPVKTARLRRAAPTLDGARA